MKKRIYIIPETEIMVLVSPVMKDLGPASMPNQNFAPKRKVEVF